MLRRSLVLIILVSAVLSATTAWAGRFGPGDRPSDFYGRNVQDNKVVRLEDFQGKWLLVDFFATWCGPCMGELPNLVKVTQPLRGARFEVLGVSLDFQNTMDELKPVLKKQGVGYPVIFPGGGWQTPAAKEWAVGAIPDSYLISPQGVVVATGLRGEDLKPALQKFLALKEPYAPTGVRAVGKLEDGKFNLKTSFNNPKAADSHCRLNIEFEVPVKNAKGEVVSWDNDKRSDDFNAPTPDGWDVEKDFSYDVPANVSSVYYTFEVFNPQVGLWIGIDGYCWPKAEK